MYTVCVSPALLSTGGTEHSKSLRRPPWPGYVRNRDITAAPNPWALIHLLPLLEPVSFQERRRRSSASCWLNVAESNRESTTPSSSSFAITHTTTSNSNSSDDGNRNKERLHYYHRQPMESSLSLSSSFLDTIMGQWQGGRGGG